MWAFHFKKEKVWIACFFSFRASQLLFLQFSREEEQLWLAGVLLFGPSVKVDVIYCSGRNLLLCRRHLFFFPLPCARISSMAWSTVTDSGILGLTCCSGAMTGYIGFSISVGDGCKCSSPGWKVGRKVQTTEKTGVFRHSSSHQRWEHKMKVHVQVRVWYFYPITF